MGCLVGRGFGVGKVTSCTVSIEAGGEGMQTMTAGAGSIIGFIYVAAATT